MILLTLRNDKDGFTWEQGVSLFLHPYIYRFACKCGLVVVPDEIILELDKTLSNGFLEYLSYALEDCIKDLYEEPNLKMLNKYPSRFEKFFYRNKKYTVNYATSPQGRIVFCVWSVYSFLKKEIEESRSVTLTLGESSGLVGKVTNELMK